MQHYKNFDGEVLDPQQVIEYAMKNKKPTIEVAYNEMFKEKYDERAAKDAEAKEKKLEEKIRAKVEDEFRAKNPTMPYTVSTEASLSPILESMQKKEKASEHGVNAALDEYYRMQRPSGA
jgi:hypothetical protein